MNKLICFFLQLTTTLSLAQWMPTNGPYGGNIHSLAGYGNRLLACSDEALYLSNNSGKSWTVNVKGYHKVVSVHKQSIYKFGVGGVKVSRDGGNTWISKTSGLPVPGDKSGSGYFAYASLGDTVLLANSTGLFMSLDADTCWTKIIFGNVTALASSGNSIMYCTYEEGDGFAFLSTDAGNSWKAISLDSLWNEPAIQVNALTFKGDTIFMGNAFSFDKGQTWSFDSIGSHINCLLSARDTLFAGTQNGLWFRSIASSWQPLGSGLERANVECVLNYSGELFAGTVDYNGLYKLAGGRWNESNTGIQGATAYGLTKTKSGIYVATARKVYAKKDEDAGWVKTENDISKEFAYSNAGMPTPYFTPDYVWKINQLNGDLYALDHSGNIHVLKKDTTEWRLFAAAKQGHLYAYDFFVYNERLFVNSGINLFEITDDSLRYISSPGLGNYYVDNNIIYASSEKEIFKSIDGGFTFVKIVDSATLNVYHIWSLAVSGKNICVGSFSEGIFISKDEGLTWTHCWSDTSNSYFKGFVKNLVLKGEMIIASVNANGKLYYSSNLGQEWTDFNDSLEINYINDVPLPYINNIVIDGNVLYIGVSNKGVYKRVLPETASNRVSEEECFTLYPNPSSDELSVLLNNMVLPAKANIFSSTGSLLFETDIHKNEERLNISALSVGLYVITCKNNSLTCKSKFVKVGVK